MNRKCRSLLAIAATATAPFGLLPSPALAQDETVATGQLQPRIENGRQIYEAGQFDRFTPRTALDMVRQVPGFTIDRGDGSRRGLGQADENVLINGQRISGKENDAVTALGRISAPNVERIEIVDGTTLSISGLTGQVLNLVLKDNAGNGVTGNFRYSPLWREAGNRWLDGEISVSGKIGKGNFTAALQNDAFRAGAAGPERVTDRFGNLLFRRIEDSRTQGDRPSLSIHYDRTSAAGSIFNIDLAGEFFRRRERVDTLRVETGQPDIIELFTSREDEWNVEFSTDYEFNLGGGRLKLIGYQRFERSPTESFFGQTFTDGVTVPTGTLFDRTVDEGESIIRSEYSWRTDGGTDWGINVEGAYNFLDSEGALLVLDPQGTFQPVPLTNATSKVTEYRGEIIGSFGRNIATNLTLQATLGGEYSQISQSGALGQSRSFVRPKGAVSLAWRPSDSLDINLSLERAVGQLNFFDFVESIDVANNVGNAGNPGLVPPQSWRAELEANRTLGPWGAITVNIFGEKISDIVDSIPITATTEARGNLDSATRYGVGLTSSILFDPIGLKGAKLDIEAEIQNSSLRDPLTRVRRRISNDDIYQYEIEFRHDIPDTDLAYGFGIEQFDGFAEVRLDQIADFDQLAPYAWLFVEHKDVLGLTVNFNLGNLFDRGERFKRTEFVGRRNGPIDFVEDRTRKFGLIYRLRISGSF